MEPSSPAGDDPHRALELARQDVERQFEDIARTHAGQPRAVVLAALERAVTRAGVTPVRADLSSLAAEISRTPPSPG